MTYAPRLTEQSIRDALDYPDAYELGVQCFRRGQVVVLDWKANFQRLLGVVKGSHSRSYLVRITLAGDSVVSTTCTCAFGSGCKHVAALLLDASTRLNRPATGGPSATTPGAEDSWLPYAAGAPWRTGGPPRPPEPEWRRLLTPLVAAPTPPDDPTTAATLALQFRVDGISAALSLGRTDSATPITLSVQPTRRQGNWGYGWPSRYGADRARPWDQEWFADLAATNTTYYSARTWMSLDSFSSRLLWTLLAQGYAAGIPFVGTKPGHSVTLVNSMDIELDLRRETDGFTISRRLLADGQPLDYPLVGLIGDTGLFAVRADGPTRDIVLGPAPRQLTAADLGLARLPAFAVADAEAPDFWRTVFPALRRRLPVTSSDQTVALPAPPHPILIGRVTFPDIVTADIAWSWEYVEPDNATSTPGADPGATGAEDRPGQPRPFAFTSDDVRDHTAERAIAERAATVLAPLGPPPLGPRARYTGQAAVTFVRLLPDLEATPDVRLRLTEPPPQYHESTADPLVTVTVADSTDSDWFDLSVTVSVEGREIPFAPLFAALARGQDYLILEDGTLLRTDLPVFARLRELITEARRLTDRPGPPRLNRYAVSLWTDFEDLADVVDQTDRWRTSVGVLAALAADGASPQPLPVPATLQAVLRPYQHRAYEWLTFLYTHGLGGILADDMGLGKTVEILAMIAGVVPGSHDSGTTPDPAATAAPFLVVAPASVVGNWAAEAARFVPSLRTLVLPATIARSGIDLAAAAREVDLVVTSYAIFRLDFAQFDALEWAGLILDEAQFLKNPRTRAHECARQLSATAKFAVTGTPMENDLTELWALLAVVAPGLFPSPTRFREDYIGAVTAASRARTTLAADAVVRIRGYSDDDRANDRQVIAAGDAALARLRRRVRPLLLRRTKSQVTPELPDRVEQILSVDLAPRHRRLYDTLLQRERQRVLGLLDDYQANRFEIFRSLMVLRRAALDAVFIDEAYEGIPSAKLDTLFAQLEDVVAEGHRALIFSQFTTFLARIGARARARGLDFEYLDGRTRHRAEVIRRFREGSAPLFLISLKAGGFGLNLTEADYVFLMDPWWNPATENQAIDRTHRIGQTRTVMVNRLVSAGTIEDKVMALKERKAALFTAVLDDDSGAFAGALAADDIRGLFEEG